MDNTEEIWKDVVGYEGFYKISSKGRVLSLARKGKGSPNSNRILKPGISSGYHTLIFRKNSKSIPIQIHRIIAIAFLQNLHDYTQVNHKNGIKTDNRVENLEWCTPSENILHCILNGRRDTAKGSRKPNATLNEEQVLKIKIFLKKRGNISFEMVAEMFGVKYGVIQNISSGRCWKHVKI